MQVQTVREWKSFESDPDEWKSGKNIFIVCVYLITALTAIIGNILTVLVLTCSSHFKIEICKYLINLAIADLLMAIFCIPFTYTKIVFYKWMFGSFLCTVVHFLQVLGVSISVFTNVSIGINR